MTDLRPIETASYASIKTPSSLGRPPKLEWIAIRDLVIDPEYQRDITNVGRTNVRHIAETFDWNKFAPVIVAAAGSGKFAIVDGQHRTTAAALCGVDRVPCAMIDAAKLAQAQAFRDINGNITRLHALQLFHAAVAAGDAEAVATIEVARRAGVTIMRSPNPPLQMKSGQTNCAGIIGKGITRFGADVCVLALRCIVETGGGNPGLLNRTIVWGTIEVLADHPEWCAQERALIEAFDTFDLEDFWRGATASAARMRGTSSTDQFEATLVAALSAHFAGRSKRA
jgi:hypothetical protein